MQSDKHLSREEILLLLDGELPLLEAAAAEEHLAICSSCRSMRDGATNLFEDVKLVDEALNAKIHSEQRAMLRARMAESQQVLKRNWRWQIPVASAAAVLLMAGVALKLTNMHSKHLPDTYVEDRPVPNPTLTPGAVRPVLIADICSANESDLDPIVPAELQQVVFSEYHVPERTRGHEFQVDYLINPQLGGTGEIKNLWPQPYTSTWNAQEKDVLETRLHSMVCSGEMRLEDAQRALAGDWIKAYQQIFRTETPLRSKPGIATNSGF